MSTTPEALPTSKTSLIAVAWDSEKNVLDFSVHGPILLIVTSILLASALLARINGWVRTKEFQIDQAELGIGQSKVTFRPRLEDRQVAYAIWVELSTRKIGLPIDLNNDVVIEIYDSWYQFFSVTRELIKGIPVQHVRRDSTQAIIGISIEVLNEGLRPHLTLWQARFRRWYERELRRHEAQADGEVIYPQEIQKQFPEFSSLSSDMDRVNKALILYRGKMRELVGMSGAGLPDGQRD